MRGVCIGALFAAVLGAQQTSTYKTSEIDINGNRVSAGPEVVATQSKTASGTTDLMQSVNGRTVPVERVEERVLRDDPSGKLIERIIRKYDPNGDPAPPEKDLIEEHKGANGAATIQTSRYFADINGGMQLGERTTTQKQVSGSSETSDTMVERPGLGGGMDTVEKQTSVTVKRNDGYQEASMTYRKDPTGNFYPAVRRVTEHTETGNHSSDNMAQYEVGPSGKLELHNQTIKNVDKKADGAEDVKVDLFVKNVPGVVNDSAALQLKEHQIIERRAGSGGIVETLSVQRPSLADPGKLDPPRQLSETICKGKCDSLP